MGEEVCAFVIADAGARRRRSTTLRAHLVGAGPRPLQAARRGSRCATDAPAHRERQGAEGAAARRAARGRAPMTDEADFRDVGAVGARRRGSRRGAPTSPCRCSAPATTISKPAARYLARARGHRARGAVVAARVRRARRDAGRGRDRAPRARRLRRPRPLPVSRRARADRPDAARARHARAVRALAADDRERRGDLVPAVLRAGRGLRPRRPVDACARATATSGACTARRCGRAAARTRATGCCSPGTTRRCRSTRASPRSGIDLHAPGRRRAAAAPDERRRALHRGVPRRRARPDADRIGAVGEGWRVALTCLSFERGAATAGSSGGLLDVDRLDRARARNAGCASRSGRPRRARPARHRAARDVAHRSAGRATPRAPVGPGPAGSGLKLRGSRDVPRLHRTSRSRILGADALDRTASRGTRCSSPRRRSRSAAAPTRSSATSSANACSACPRSPASTATLPFDQLPASSAR